MPPAIPRTRSVGTNVGAAQQQPFHNGKYPALVLPKTREITSPEIYIPVSTLYYDEIVADSPVAWYRMQEASGLIQDSSGNANHAVSSSGSPGYGEPSPIFNDGVDKAINFASSYFSATHSTSMQVGDVFSVECWIKPSSSSPGNYSLVAHGNWSLVMDGATGLYPRVHVDNTHYVSGYPTSIAVNDPSKWYHLVWVKNGGSFKVYINAVLVLSDTGVETLSNASGGLYADLYIGTGAFGAASGAPLLDEVAFYGTALSEQRIASHYAVGIGLTNYEDTVVGDTPAAYYRMDEASGLPQDSSGNGNHITTLNSGTITYGETGPIVSDPADTAQGSAQLSPANAGSLDFDDVFSIEMWLKSTDTGIGNVCYMPSGFTWNGGTNIYMQDNGGSTIVASTIAINDGQWHHVVLVKNGSSSAKIYIDGLDCSGSVTDHTCSSSGDITIGGVLGYNYVGKWDEVALYNYPLTVDQVREHYAIARKEPESIPKSGTDSGSGSDASVIAAQLSGTDTGTDSEASTLTVQLSGTDTGTDSENATFVITATDTGAGTEVSALTITATDTGAGTEQITLVKPDTDSGTGTDASTLTVQLSVTDSGTDSENGIVTVPITATDSGTGTDASTLTATYTATDTGAGTDDLALTRQISDSGTATESVAIAIVLSDTGTGVDEISAFTRQLPETASGTDDSILSAGNAKSGSDTGSGTDASTLTVALTSSDTGAGTEASAIAIIVTDTGAGAETVVLTATQTVIDSGAGSDTAAASTADSKTGTDSGTSVENALLSFTATVNDAGVAVDASAFVIFHSVSDSGIADEVVGLWRVVTDSVTGVDLGAFGQGLLGIDSGTATENSSLNMFTAEFEMQGSELISVNAAERSILVSAN